MGAGALPSVSNLKVNNMAKVKETAKQKAERKANSTPESRFQGFKNAQRTYALHRVTAAKARKRRSK